MKRAIILIAVLTGLCIVGSVWVDLFQARTAEGYLHELPALRKAILAEDWVDLMAREPLMYARWQHDQDWLNVFINHHHTRSVSAAMLRLATATEMKWQKEALQAVDLLQEALSDVLFGDYYSWENIF